MVVGILTLAKSTLINRLAGGQKARTEDRPGVTTRKQWVKIHPFIDLLDTPGLLWPNQMIKCNAKPCFYWFYKGWNHRYLWNWPILFWIRLWTGIPGRLREIQTWGILKGWKGYQLLEVICKNQGWIRTGGIPDLEREPHAVEWFPFRQTGRHYRLKHRKSLFMNMDGYFFIPKTGGPVFCIELLQPCDHPVSSQSLPNRLWGGATFNILLPSPGA